MITIEKTIEIEAPVEQVFGYTSDPAHTPEYMPSAYKVKDLQRLPDGRYTYTLVNKLLGGHRQLQDRTLRAAGGWQDPPRPCRRDHAACGAAGQVR